MKLRRNRLWCGKSSDDFDQRQGNAGATRAMDFYCDKSGADLDEIRSSRNSASKRLCGRVLEINHGLWLTCHQRLFSVHSAHRRCFVPQDDRHCSRRVWWAHRVRVSAMLDDAVYHPKLQFVVEAVPHTAVSDFISTEARHSFSILCNRSPCI